MPANTAPIFTLTPKRGGGTWTNSLTANVKNDGTATAIATDMLLLYTAGTNGALISKIRMHPAGSTAATATTATVGRVYTSTITSGATTNANTRLWEERACPAQTTDQTTTATNYIEFTAGITLSANETLLFSMHHIAAANTVWEVTVFGGDY